MDRVATRRLDLLDDGKRYAAYMAALAAARLYAARIRHGYDTDAIVDLWAADLIRKETK